MEKNELIVANTTELKNGEMKEITIGETKIVLAKANDELYAVGGTCPHLKAPLAKGALCGTKLYCPWHHSVFDIATGQLCEPPAIDGLPRYNVRTEGENIIIDTIPISTSKNKIASPILSDSVFVIVGGGAAGFMAAQTLRQEGFSGQLVMITKEDISPYDRTLLSKKFLMGKIEPDMLPLRKESFYKDNNIDLEKNKTVQAVEAEKNLIHFTDNTSLQYDKLLLATGSTAMMLKVTGADLPNVYNLRSIADAEKILETAKSAKRVCIIGASFIAMETAASLKTLGLEVTVLARETLPFKKNFGKELGELFTSLHKEKGTVIKTNAKVDSIEGTVKATAVVLEDGERIETDFVIMGVGVQPNTSFLKGIDVDENDSSIKVNAQLQATDNLFVAGDIAKFPDAQTGQLVRIEHWRLAQQHGRIAALNMLGQTHTTDEIVPFFWTNQFDKRLSYVGHSADWDTIEIEGNIKEQKFLAFYVKNGKVQATASMGRDVESNKIENAMLKKGLFSVEDLKNAMAE